MELIYGPNFGFGVDKRLMDIIKEAAKQSPYQVTVISGKNERKKGTPWHPSGRAIDVSLKDPESGKTFKNYQNAKDFRPYEQFAQTARSIQQQKYPELNDAFRFGGYFSGKKGNYGSLDPMHLDIGGGKGAGMLGGSWAGGLNANQRQLWPGINSVGMDTSSPAPSAGLSARPPQAPIGAGLSAPQVPVSSPQPQGIEDTLKKIFGAELSGIGGGKGNILSRIGGALGKLGGGEQQAMPAPDLPNPPSTVPPPQTPVPIPFEGTAGGDAQGTQDMAQTSPLAAMASQLTPEQVDMMKKMGLI